ncbi:4-hydroxy-tetrahydrodipicolinate synthase [Paraburkholderia tropica]|uniref:4-hydroxy-tetrahydrodipicolinate synthase n=1 Tax=Paraburkholderia tropica TaxID=92647 RepID=UPI002AB0FFD8|nr:4-hydroxy-tetrahydrodipicolinate synthase [Paraburkholderia tropica]
MSIFSGVWIPLVTPFNNGEIDHAALKELVRHYVEAGVSGFVALGTTGEPASLTDQEQDAVVWTVLDAAGDIPVIVGVSGNNTQAVCERATVFDDTPVAGLLISAPYYIRPSQAGLIGHFTAIANVCKKPIVLYDIPARTGVQLELETLLLLSQHERIVAVKDCGGIPDKTLGLIRDGGLKVLCGEDLEMFGALCCGASGTISASAHLCADQFVAMFNAIREERLADAREIWHELVPLVQVMFAEPNPGPVKAALSLRGHIRNELRAPMTLVSDDLVCRLSGWWSLPRA